MAGRGKWTDRHVWEVQRLHHMARGVHEVQAGAWLGKELIVITLQRLRVQQTQPGNGQKQLEEGAILTPKLFRATQGELRNKF